MLNTEFQALDRKLVEVFEVCVPVEVGVRGSLERNFWERGENVVSKKTSNRPMALVPLTCDPGLIFSPYWLLGWFSQGRGYRESSHTDKANVFQFCRMTFPC